MLVKDKRLKLTNEMLLGMKSIKMYSWEPIFEKALIAARLNEVLYLFFKFFDVHRPTVQLTSFQCRSIGQSYETSDMRKMSTALVFQLYCIKINRD